ncbi:non-ribosomal peptide synthetase [Saccharomonospora cyanea]|uniref:Amino acid adenylation enzyme/thioester reductase family protein n=1 Tax=Saccharomonospora cyanea NA-134 TaxID=882082 RepID=H5XI23_9PSEU|nr:non-ribosomal peptide synthetase [Saccharomonospora cyanea]EHR60653.1 amino acid adenylation enzyme/thioester reductase family protein [Saccharomonospora cyanea NA-134]
MEHLAETSLPRLVAEQAARTPDAIAVIDDAGSLTYAELDARANRLAHLLRAHGVGEALAGEPDSVVGVCLHRSVTLVVALLAVWRAGAAYLPLDPGHPGGRLVSVARSAAPRLVLTQTITHDAVAVAGVRTVVLDRDLSVAAGQPSDDPGPVIDPDAAAYVLHTSGSTGTPKGVVVPHAGIGNRIDWVVRTHGLGPGDRVLQKTALTFDASIWEVFAPLVCGATVVLAPVGAERDPAVLAGCLAERDITVLQVVPSLLRVLVEEPALAECHALRLLFSAGEQLHAELVHQFLNRLPDPSAIGVWNTYGPTECSIDVTAHRFDPAQRSGPVPIGRPIDGLRALVLDPSGRPVEAGEQGELHAGGTGLARGYLGRPDLTAERFVPDPTSTSGERLYRTGDMVRVEPDGVLTYLGRRDHQVKVNGVRIEPGEVEAALAAHPGLGGAVVLGYPSAEGGTRLAAYVRTSDGEVPAGLRDFLAEHLPETHLPSAFIGLTAFPTTSSGKIDRSALPAPDQRAPSPTRPDSAEEALVAEVWRELLKIDEIRHDDDFFVLGGSSLQFTRLANRLRKASGTEIDLRSLLSATTLAAQAKLLGTARRADETIRPVPRDGGLPLSSGQRRIWLLDRMNPRSREWISALFVRIDRGVAVADVQAALDALVSRHESLRTRFVLRGDEPVQLVDPPSGCELTTATGAHDDFVTDLDAWLDQGFDLRTGPPVRALLYRPEAGEAVLVLAMHHIVCDGWSSAVLERDLREILAARSAGRPPALAPLPVQYADFAVWQRQRHDGDGVRSLVEHWRVILDDAKPTEPRTDLPRPARRDGRGGIVGFTVPASVATALDSLGKRVGATPFMTLLTGFATLLARYQAEWDVVVGTPVAGRDRPELENVVGFFLNNLVLRCSLDPGDDFTGAVAEVRDTCRDAFSHQDVPFDMLVAELAPDRDLSRTPLYQVAFDFHDEQLTGSAADPDDWRTLLDVSRIAKTDLTMYLRPRPDGSLAGGLEYATALFAEETVERMCRHFLALLDAVTADPTRPLAEIDFVAGEEAATLREVAAGAELGEKGFTDATVVDAVERQAADSPEATAVVCGSTRVTFAELDRAANRLAHRLRDLGAGPDRVVGVLLDRRPELLSTLLGVWKSGAAYLPLDPANPAARVAAVLSDAGASALVTTAAEWSRVSGEVDGVAPVLLDEEASTLAAGPSQPPARVCDADLLAYVIYTSGSTGTPKGVQVTHGGVANHVRWAVDELAKRGTGGAPVFSSVAFDLVVPNLWAPLAAGQPVHLVPSDVDLTELGTALTAAAPFSFLKLTPGHLKILSHQLDPAARAELANTVVVAGEVLPTVLAREWVGALGEGRLINEYGPTEASVGTCVHPVSPEPGGASVPIGKPLPGVTMRVLDDRLRPVPIGVVGELYVGGAGLARGYLGRPTLTAASFLPDPDGPPGGRLYRTGDLARVLASGDVEFVGRRDQQVKIRGHRVELAEIEGVLSADPRVRDAVVVADGDEAGRTVLAAFCTGADQVAVTDPTLVPDLLEACARQLPEYMVPTSCHVLERLPLSANGKLDRRALLAHLDEEADDTAALEGVVERRVAELFSELLGRPAGRDTDFFTAGGNSILAIQLVAAVQAAFETELPIRAVFEGPTVSALATVIEERVRAEIDELDDEDLGVTGAAGNLTR